LLSFCGSAIRSLCPPRQCSHEVVHLCGCRESCEELRPASQRRWTHEVLQPQEATRPPGAASESIPGQGGTLRVGRQRQALSFELHIAKVCACEGPSSTRGVHVGLPQGGHPGRCSSHQLLLAAGLEARVPGELQEAKQDMGSPGCGFARPIEDRVIGRVLGPPFGDKGHGQRLGDVRSRQQRPAIFGDAGCSGRSLEGRACSHEG
jgi:hypothetical protein